MTDASVTPGDISDEIDEADYDLTDVDIVEEVEGIGGGGDE